jgi:hypothetical protein
MPDLVRITLYWHARCSEGRELAGSVFRWFRGDPQDPGEAGRGIPVHYRSLPGEPSGAALAADAPAAGTEQAPRFHIAVPLVDEHMVVDRAWRTYLTEVIAPGSHLVVPVALDSAAYQLPHAINRLNYLRLERAVDPADWSWERRTRVRRERLVSLLTQVIARELLGLPKQGLTEPTPPNGHRPAAPPQIKVFISHAKADGAPAAEALRAAILGRGQLQAFYDESDLPIGYEFERLLVDAAGDGEAADTQAMVAIYTDRYPTRPWCERELRQARRPRPRGESGAAARCWRVKPLVVVADLAGAETRMLGEVGQAPLIAWDPRRAGRIVDALLREILLLRYNEARAFALLQRPASTAGEYALNAAPDAHAAMAVARAAGGALAELLVPPPGPGKEVREALEGILSAAGNRVHVRTFDEVELNQP